MVHKVVAYVHQPDALEHSKLLVFTHRDYPEAGIQVPAGTVEPGEGPADAVLRELAEETGLADCRMVRQLGASQFIKPDNNEIGERTFFLLSASPGVAETWQHTVYGAGQDQGMVFIYSWKRADETLLLAGNLGQFLTQYHVPELYSKESAPNDTDH